MNELIDAPWWVVLLTKTTLLLAVAWCVHAALVRANPGWRVLLWRATAVGMLLLPLIEVLPGLQWKLQREVSTTTSPEPLPNVDMVESRTPTTNHVGVNSTDESTERERSGGRESSKPVVRESSPVILARADQTPAKRKPQRASVPPAFSVANVSWSLILGSIWCMVCGGSTLRTLIGWRRLQAIIGAAGPAPDWVQRLASETAQELSVRRAFDIRVSDRVETPLVCRTLRPMLLLPRYACDSQERREMQAILAHEIAHIQSHDVAWNALLYLVSVACWWHPLTWRMRLSHANACEHVADAASARMMGDAAEYGRTLAKIALCASNDVVLPGLAMARVADVRRRLSIVERTIKCKPIGRLRFACVLLVSILAIVMVGGIRLVAADPPAKKPDKEQQAAVEKAEKKVPAGAPRLVMFRVVDTEGNPLTDADVKARAGRDAVKTKGIGNGHFAVTFPLDAPSLHIWAKMTGYVPVSAGWRGREVKDALDEAFTIVLEKGTTIGGIIHDEDGQPIAGVNVLVLVPSDEQARVKPNVWDHLVRTDERGRWYADIMPSKLDDVWIRLAHDDYISDDRYGDTKKPSMKKLRDRTGVMVMKKGIVVSGTVVNPKGKPVAGAMVYQGSDRFGSHYPETMTDDAGRFSFGESKTGKMVLTTVAKGFAPELTEISVKKDLKPAKIVLKKGKTLRIRTVASDGKPIGGVLIAPDTWRGHRSLPSANIPRKSNDQGVYVWKNAPHDAISFDILKQGYKDNRDQLLAPREEEHVVKMLRPLVVTGRVIDAETKQPIDKFRLVPGFDWGEAQPGRVTWERRRIRELRGGKYETTFTSSRNAHLVRVEAEGYRPGISRVFKPDEGRVEFDIEMTPNEPLTGTIFLPDGSPAAKADVIVATVDAAARVRDGRLETRAYNAIVQTDEQGHFQVDSPEPVFTLVVLHEQGMIEVTHETYKSGMELKLDAWSKVRGTVKIGSKPASGHRMIATVNRGFGRDQPRVSFTSYVDADARGRFEFDRVPPKLTIQIARVMRTSETSTRYVYPQVVESQPAETHEVQIGGRGRPVIGRVRIPKNAPALRWAMFNSLDADRPEIPTPENFKAMSEKEQGEWYAAWQKSAAGKRHAELFRRRFTPVIQDDGTFRIDDVPTGTYTLNIRAHDAANKSYNAPVLASFTQKVIVREVPSGQSDEPLDLGTLEPEKEASAEDR